MSVASTAIAIRYTGNGSTVTPYAIPFPFLDSDHIYAAVSSDGEEEPVLLSLSDYVVTPNDGSPGGSLVTVEAVTSPATITIFRSVPLTQPAVFQVAGPFPAKSNETAFDRLVMQVQQVSARVDEIQEIDNGGFINVPDGSGSLVDVPTWANTAARGAVVPKRAGQLGVQRDSQTVWIAQSATTGDWEEFAPVRRNRLVLGLVSDVGNPGTAQTAAAALLNQWELDAVLFAGDNNQNGASEYTNDWAAFASFIAAGDAYPALGNYDMDETGWEARHAAKFPYLPGNKRYYNVVLGDGLVELFVLNSGIDSTADLKEPDGIIVGSTQHTWFVAALAASKARWKIVMFHHPPVSLSDAAGSISTDMAWPEFAQVDLLLCGHTHLLEILKWNNVQLVNLSASIDAAGSDSGEVQGGEISDCALWSDATSLGVGRIVASQEKLTVEVWEPDVAYIVSRVLHVRDARDLGLDLDLGLGTMATQNASAVAITGGSATLTDNLIISTAGKGVRIKEGSNARMGTVTLTAGAATVANTSVTANTRIFLTRKTPNASTGLGVLSVNTVTASTSFSIFALDLTAQVETNDVSTVEWLLVEPAA